MLRCTRGKRFLNAVAQKNRIAGVVRSPRRRTLSRSLTCGRHAQTQSRILPVRTDAATKGPEVSDTVSRTVNGVRLEHDEGEQS